MHRLFAAALALAFAAPAFADGGETWYADYDKAVAAAKKEGKDLLIDFTGSDWCVWCHRLDKEVFSDAAFLEAIQKNYVLVALDFPRGEEAKAKVPNPDRNNELMKTHGVRGFPTVLLMNTGGEVYCRTGYREGGAEKYLKFVDDNRTQFVAAVELTAKLAMAEEEAKAALIEKAIELLDKMDAGNAGAAKLADPVRSALKLDPENAKGLKSKALRALMTAGQADDDVHAAAVALDANNKLGLRELVVKAQYYAVHDQDAAKAAIAALKELEATGPFKDQKLAFELFARTAVWSARALNDPETAKAYAKKAKEIGSDNEQIMQLLDQILGS